MSGRLRPELFVANEDCQVGTAYPEEQAVSLVATQVLAPPPVATMLFGRKYGGALQEPLLRIEPLIVVELFQGSSGM